MDIIFYEKPGCGNNTRQKALLAAAGHCIVARNLLTEPWSAEKLRPFFGDRPIAEWFNRAAPRIKSGEVIPELLDECDALHLMLEDPLLIRRPLIEVGEHKEAGFDAAIRNWLGVPESGDTQTSLERCSKPHGHPPCAMPTE